MSETTTPEANTAVAGQLEPMVMFGYVDITTKGCEGWLNLFFGQQCVALVDNIHIANEMRRSIKPMKRLTKIEWTEPCEKCGVSVPVDLVLPHTCMKT